MSAPEHTKWMAKQNRRIRQMLWNKWSGFLLTPNEGVARVRRFGCTERVHEDGTALE